MSKTLIVVESPKKARELQKFLGDQYVIRASQGHVVDLISSQQNKLGIDIEHEFKPCYAVIPDKQDKLNAILDAAKTADHILLASDPDREGEAIAWHIADAMKHIKTPKKRVLIYEITKAKVLKAIKEPLELNAQLYDAQQARRVLDRIVGFLVSPFVINTIGPNLSAGRVQSVAVRLIVDREREIEAFVPEEYWSINAALAPKDKPTSKFAAKIVEKVDNKTRAEKIKSDLDKDTYIVTDVVSAEKVKKPEPPLKTSTLQQIASRRYNLNSAKTMKAAQSLYESGLVTYIRTDSIRSAPEAIQECREWIEKSKFDLPKSPVIYTAKEGAQDAHEAIRPTSLQVEPDKINFGSNDEKYVYLLIRERFIASQMKPALYDTLAVTIKSSSDHILKSHGRTLKYGGFLDFTGEVKVKNEDEAEAKLPPLKTGDVLTLVPPKVKADQKFTQPPSRYKNHTLVQTLEEKGIGRPSTYASIIQKVTDRSYVELKKDTFFATDLGKKIVDLLKNNFEFMKYEYTSSMEDKLDLIENGKYSYLEMMTSFFPEFVKQLKRANRSTEKDYGINCWVCKQPMNLKHGKFGYYMSCLDYPDCKTSKSCELIDGKPVLKEHYNVNVEENSNCPDCPKCQSKMIIRDGKFGKFYSCSSYPKCMGSKKIPSGVKCTKCGHDTYVTLFGGESKLACLAYPECKNIFDLPVGFKSEWIPPQELQDKKTSKAVKKIINMSR